MNDKSKDVCVCVCKRERAGMGKVGGCLVWLGVICLNLLHVNLSEQQEPDYPSNNGHTLIC